MMRSVLRSIYGDVLSRAEVADEDNFFALGGDSISAVRIAALVGDRLGIGIDFVEVLNHPTVGLLDAALSGRPEPASAGRDLASPAPHGACAASPVQQSLYALHRLAGPHAFVEPIVIRLPGRLDPDRLAAAFDSVLERHQVLRTTFAVDPVDGLRATVREVSDAFVHCPGPWSAAGLGAAYRDALHEPFDVERGPLVRLRLLTGADPVSHLLLSCHHLVSDGLTAMTIEDELLTHYRAAASPHAEQTADQYADYAQWLHRWCASEAADAARAFWRAALAGWQPSAGLAANTGTSAIDTTAGLATVRHDRMLDAATTRAVRAASARHGVSVAVFLQACVRAAWTALSGQSDVVLGVAASTRQGGRCVGPYVNTLPVRTTGTAGEPFADLLRRTDLANRSALGHRLLPIEHLQADIADGQSLFEIGFTHQRVREVPGLLAIIGEQSVAEPLGIPLLVVGYETPGELRIRLRYRPSMVAAELPDRLWAALTGILADACSTPRSRAALIPAGRTAETFDLNLDD